ncbi:RNA-directed DNA polymerase from mobile element jockey [Eumeta japonica]|uniref:RNA-directed DNA polymerase from mobile element jockey n=1 Tax=Eumeta variegata TaxID=151549 RepID=A0A4C1WQ91_EUMVA|nr:RNA-directed DNA polymerase from mobile element jockey [Eumeta japonica]
MVSWTNLPPLPSSRWEHENSELRSTAVSSAVSGRTSPKKGPPGKRNRRRPWTRWEDEMKRTAGPKSDPCSFLTDPGPCSDFQVKWTYNPLRQDCVAYEYGGCEGNANSVGRSTGALRPGGRAVLTGHASPPGRARAVAEGPDGRARPPTGHMRKFKKKLRLLFLEFVASVSFYTPVARAQLWLHGIKITVDSIVDFRSLNSLLIKSNIPFHTYALEEERKIKAVLRNIPLEISTDCIKSDLESQNYPVFAVHRMHRRDGTVIGHVLAVLHKSDTARTFSNPRPKIATHSPAVSNAANRTQQKSANAPKTLVTSQSVLTATARVIQPVIKAAPKPPTSSKTFAPPPPTRGPEHPRGPYLNRLRLSGSPCRPQPNRNLLPAHWRRHPHHHVDAEDGQKPGVCPTGRRLSESKEREDRLMVILRHQDLLNRLEKYNGKRTWCSATISIGRHKPKSISLISFNARGLESNIVELGKCATEYSADVILVQETFLKPNRPRACKLANYIQVRNDRLNAPKGGTAVYYKRKLYCCPVDTPPLINIEASACRLAMTGHGTLIIVSVYLPPHKPLLRSDIETLLALGDAVILFGDLNSKNTDWRSNTTNTSGRMLATLAEDHDLAIIAPLTPTYLPANVRHRPNILDLAILKGVVLSLNSIETVHCLGSDHLPVLLKLGSSTGENPNIATKTIIDWKRVSTALEEVDTPNLNVIPDDIVSNNDIDTAIGALTKHIRSVVKRCQRKVPANSDRRGLPADVRELIRAKNAALRRASAYPTPEYRSRARALQREVKARVREAKMITGAT